MCYEAQNGMRVTALDAVQPPEEVTLFSLRPTNTNLVTQSETSSRKARERGSHRTLWTVTELTALSRT